MHGILLLSDADVAITLSTAGAAGTFEKVAGCRYPAVIRTVTWKAPACPFTFDPAFPGLS